MYDILDPADRWIGTPGASAVSFSNNKAPIAIDDALSLAKDSGPVSVAVLDNDHDIEGADLTLISASAALGTAVAEADNSVTYTPPPGITGFDTVVYEVADDLGQRRSAQINVTITEPPLSVIVQPDNTMLVTAGTGPFDLTITEPSRFAGTYALDTADFLGGPVNLSPPTISGTVSSGQELTAEPGLWLNGTTSGLPVRSWKWRRDGVDIPNATASNYTVTATDETAILTAIELQTDTAGQRFSESNTLAGSGLGFTPSFDTSLLSWHDASDAATLTVFGGAVQAWSDKGGGADLTQLNGILQPETDARLVNGRNVLDFRGGPYLEKSLNIPASGNLAIHLALEIDATPSQFAAILALDATNDMQIDAASDTEFLGRLNPNGIGTAAAFTGGPFMGGQIISVLFDATGAGTAEIYVGNVLRATMAYTAPLDATQTLTLMANRNRNAAIDGAICELVITSDLTNRTDHHVYLASKWGIT